jgi:uncharacterized protein YcaQ
VTVHELSRLDARRIAVRAQLLDRPPLLDRQRPGGGLLDVVRQLTLLQIDPVAAIAPSADLVAWSRLGSAYSPAELDTALTDRTLLELRATRNLPDSCQVPWRSTGWTNNRNVTQLLEFMVRRGEVAIAGRLGGDRLWDLATRVYPDDPVVPREEALRIRNERRLRALGIARARGPECPVEPADVGEAGEPAVVEGVKGTWRVDPGWTSRSRAVRRCCHPSTG